MCSYCSFSSVVEVTDYNYSDFCNQVISLVFLLLNGAIENTSNNYKLLKCTLRGVCEEYFYSGIILIPVVLLVIE